MRGYFNGMCKDSSKMISETMYGAFILCIFISYLFNTKLSMDSIFDGGEGESESEYEQRNGIWIYKIGYKLVILSKS